MGTITTLAGEDHIAEGAASSLLIANHAYRAPWIKETVNQSHSLEFSLGAVQCRPALFFPSSDLKITTRTIDV
jgi:hypothetical protein